MMNVDNEDELPEDELGIATSFISNIGGAPEDTANILYFKLVLAKYAGNLYELIFRLESDSGSVLYTNVASHCILAGKYVFFEAVLSACPPLMVYQCVSGTGEPVLTPLSCAVLKRDMLATQTILSHPALLTSVTTWPERHINVINNSLKLAKSRFKAETHGEKEIIRKLEAALEKDAHNAK